MKLPSRKPQYEVVITDFHGGWLIEVHQVEGQFQALCRSANRAELGDRKFYLQPLQAHQAAIRLIDDFFARFATKQALRELFEADKLSFDEWQALANSLNPSTTA